jgi:hypothetical protein
MSRLKNNFSRLLNTNISPASKVTLNKMSKNFDEMKVIMKLKLRNATDESETYKSLTKLFEKEFVAQDYSCFLESF